MKNRLSSQRLTDEVRVRSSLISGNVCNDTTATVSTINRMNTKANTTAYSTVINAIHHQTISYHLMSQAEDVGSSVKAN